jgi:hypothetical protein
MYGFRRDEASHATAERASRHILPYTSTSGAQVPHAGAVEGLTKRFAEWYSRRA